MIDATITVDGLLIALGWLFGDFCTAVTKAPTQVLLDAEELLSVDTGNKEIEAHAAEAIEVIRGELTFRHEARQ